MPKPKTACFPTFEWAYVGAHASSVEDAWRPFADQLKAVGFEVSGFAYNVHIDTVFPSESELYGVLISQEFVENCRKPNANDTRFNDMRFRVPAASMHGQQVLIEPDRIANEPIAAQERAIVELLREFGLRCGWTTPIPDRESGRYSLVALSELGDPRHFHSRLQRYGAAIARASIHFTEGLAVGAIAQAAGNDPLTPRESDCLAWTSAGLSSKQIAERLRISMSTVNEYLASAQRKLNANNRTQAVARSLLLGQITP